MGQRDEAVARNPPIQGLKLWGERLRLCPGGDGELRKDYKHEDDVI